jgi:uncharacterized protein (DUF488 family)
MGINIKDLLESIKIYLNCSDQMIKKNKIFTIGHSTHQIDTFLQILKKNHINVVIDVRSIPYSRFANQYNKDNLKSFLKSNDIFYIPMGDLLGARHEDDSLLFNDGKVNFQKVVSTNKFNDGIKRINEGLNKGYTIVLMCSEKNPLECHRFSLISHFLDEHGYDVNHILPEGLIPHKLLDKKLFDYFESKRKLTFEIDKLLNLHSTQFDLFNTTNKEDVYIVLNKLVAFNPYSKTEHAE